MIVKLPLENISSLVNNLRGNIFRGNTTVYLSLGETKYTVNQSYISLSEQSITFLITQRHGQVMDKKLHFQTISCDHLNHPNHPNHPNLAI